MESSLAVRGAAAAGATCGRAPYHASKGSAPERSGSVARAPSAYVLGGGPRIGWLLRSAMSAAGAVAVGAASAYAVSRIARGRAVASPEREQAARRLHEAAGVLSLSVLMDSTLEHYRGDFQNAAMFIAPTVAAATLVAACGARSSSQGAGPTHRAVYGAAAITGAMGLGFHLYNLRKREGGVTWNALFYGAPLGAPAAISLAGVFGLAATRVEALSGRNLAGLSAVGIVGTLGEVWLLHFRGAFQNPFMYAPFTAPPLAAAGLALVASRPGAGAIATTRGLLAATAAVGLAGVGFHAYGVSRNMGGWGNWRQMLFQGPPVPAPPAFTGAALAGLAALALIEENR